MLRMAIFHRILYSITIAKHFLLSSIQRLIASALTRKFVTVSVLLGDSPFPGVGVIFITSFLT